MLEVTKALVIGLGSTGAEICSRLAQRISWEMQIQPGKESIKENVPWIRFLCVETNATGKPRNIEPEDFITLTISADEWRNVLQFASAYDEVIHLQQWADMKTLKQLHDNAITAGAGNIRMVGRLAFLYPPNFEKVHLAVNSKIVSLQTLDQHSASLVLPEALQLKDEKVFFKGNSGKPVIYVVGTLCGGTCSGIVSDFGFFLRSKTDDDQYKIGFFTLPHRNLTPTMDDRAERLKRNAYTALVELNQYYYVSGDKKIGIRFPDGTYVTNTSSPYDYLFIASPKELGATSIAQLHTAIADCIFLNLFAPDTLPMAMGVDAASNHETLTDADYQSHVFCTFGLSTLEYPAQRIADACTYRFANYTLNEWLHGSHSFDLENDAAKCIGSWDSLLNRFQMITEVEAKIEEEIGKKHKWNIQSLEDAIDAQHKKVLADLATLHYDVCKQIADEIVNRISGRIQNYLQCGGGYMAASGFLSSVKDELSNLRHRCERIAMNDVKEIFANIPEVLDKLHRLVAPKRFFLFFTKAHPAQEVNKWLNELLNCWKNGLRGSAEMRLARAMLGNGDFEGIISRIEKAINLYKTRLENLKYRITQLSVEFHQQDTALSSSPPEVNGEVIWSPSIVDEEYRQSFIDPADPLTEWTEKRKTRSHAIIEEVMQPIAKDVLAAPHAEDWLVMPADDETGYLPQEVYNNLLRLCRQNFEHLQRVNVLERWASEPKSDLLAKKAWDKASRFLDVDTTKAKQGGFPDVLETQALLRPKTPKAGNFEAILASEVKGKWLDSPTPSRVIIANYSFRFPLRGVGSVTGIHGIALAAPKEKRLFFSRRDVAWVGLTEKELERIRTAEMLVAVALLTGILRPKDNHLQYDTGIETPAGRQVMNLPLSLREAATFIASPDNGKNLLKILAADIAHYRSRFSDGAWDLPFLNELVIQLHEKKGAEVPDWNDKWLEKQIARYCALDDKLRKAYAKRFPPSESMRQLLWRRKDEPLVTGRPAPRDGYYCNICGGDIGVDEAEAAAFEWRCRVDLRHKFGTAEEA